MANDIRLLQHDWQLEEPFGSSQIGSSAMAYKRNPMRCERICSLSRYLMADVSNAAMTASVQWLERSLDDSANRRISMPEAFLCADAVLRLVIDVVSGLRVNEKIIEKALNEYMPFFATENILMEGVKRGGDRQKLHETIRVCSMEASQKMKNGGECDLPERLADTGAFGMTAGGMRVDVDFLAARSKGLLGHATLQDAFELRFLKLASIQQALRVFDRTHFLPAFLRMFSTAFVICSVV